MDRLKREFSGSVSGDVHLDDAQRHSSLLDGRFDHDSCGVGFVASIDANASHEILTQALTALARLAHRGATAADGKSSDGVGVTMAVPRTLLLEEAGISLGADE